MCIIMSISGADRLESMNAGTNIHCTLSKLALLCVRRLAACLQRASLQMPLPDASSYAAPPDLASVEGSAAVMTGGGKTARGSSLAGRTCILTEAAQVCPSTCWHEPLC